MLLSDSEKAKQVRSIILDIVIVSINERTGGGTKIMAGYLSCPPAGRKIPRVEQELLRFGQVLFILHITSVK